MLNSINDFRFILVLQWYLKVLRPFEWLLLCQKLLIRLKKLVNVYRHDRFCNPSFPRRAGGALVKTWDGTWDGTRFWYFATGRARTEFWQAFPSPPRTTTEKREKTVKKKLFFFNFGLLWTFFALGCPGTEEIVLGFPLPLHQRAWN